MPRDYLKKARLHARSDASETKEIVREPSWTTLRRAAMPRRWNMQRSSTSTTARSCCPSEAIEAAATQQVPEKLRRDIEFSHANVKKFAEAQKATLKDIEVEIVPGLIAGQKSIPVEAAGCYVPGGRYSHIASAIMTVTTAKVAGCKHIAACSPPRPGRRHRTGDHLRRAYLRRRPDPRHGRRAGRRRDDLRPLRPAQGELPRRARATSSSPRPSASCSAASAST